MVTSALTGFLPPTIPATTYWTERMTTSRTRTTTTTRRRACITDQASPVYVRLRKMPKMCSGSRGMMIRSMSLVMIARNSTNPLRRTPRGTIDRPIPRMKDSNRAVMTSTGAGISILKYVSSALPGFSTSDRAVPERRSGRSAAHTP